MRNISSQKEGLEDLFKDLSNAFTAGRVIDKIRIYYAFIRRG